MRGRWLVCGSLCGTLTIGALAAEPTNRPRCSDDVDGGCWQAVDNLPGCDVWHSGPQYDVLWYEGESDCGQGRLTGTGTLTARWQASGESRWWDAAGPWVAGREDGAFLFSFSDGRKWEVPYSAGELDGIRKITFAESTNRKTETWARGKLHGPYSERNDGGMHGERPELGRPVGAFQVEGNYVDGKRDGRWAWTYDGGSLEQHYLDGERHGPAVEVSAAGERWEREYVSGERHRGTWTREWHGGVVASVEYLAGDVTALSLAGVVLPTMAPPAPGFSAIDGAFGIELGTDLAQFRGLHCRDWNFLHDVAEGLEQSCTVMIAGALLEGPRSIAVENPREPVAGAQAHVAYVSPDRGIAELSVFMPPFGGEQAFDERDRLEPLLRSKYGTECDGMSGDKPYRTKGQCDVRGVLARTASVNIYCEGKRYGAEIEPGNRRRGVQISYRARTLADVDDDARRREAAARRNSEEAGPLQLDDL